MNMPAVPVAAVIEDISINTEEVLLTETEKLLRAHLAQAWQGIFKQDTAMAMSFAQKASIIYPESPDVSHVLGVLASRDGRSDLALPLLQKALNGGVTERRLRDMAEALLTAHQPQAAYTAISDAITQYGESTESLGLLSAIQVALEDFIGAKASAKSAIALKPHLMAWDSNLGFCELITRQVVNGFKALTGRAENLQSGSRAPALQFAPPCEIWLKNEQGPGDTIFNLRYAPALVEKGFKLHIQTDKKTKVLLRDTGLFASVKEEFTCPANAFWLNVGDLPLAAIQLTEQEVAASLALVPDASRVQKLRDKLAKIGPAPYIAVTWRAGPRGKNMRNGLRMFSKKMQAHDLGQVLSKITATVISVQRIPEADENLAFKQGLGRDFVDFSVLNDQLQDMLALLSIVDQYVAVPNTNVHLRESLGLSTEVFVNRPFQDWRWLAEGDASPWYPNAYVYRQPQSGDWAEPLVLLQQRLSLQFLQQAVKAPAGINVAAAQALVEETLLEQTSDDALKSHLNAGWLAVNNADIAEAIKVAQSVLKLRNEYPPALHLLGWAAYRDGKAELAQGVLQRALELAPTNGKIAGDFIRVLTANKQTALALKFATSAIEDVDMKEKAAIFYARAASHIQLNQYQAALADYDACLNLSPNSLDALCYSGMVRLKLGDANRGFKYYSARPESRLPSRSEGHVCPWLRGDLTGLKVLVKRDMGLGDELTYLRYLPWLSNAGVQVDYWAGNKLVPMLTRLGYANHVLSDQTPLPNTENYDLTIWVHELPVAVDALSAPEIAPPLPLSPRADLVEKWQAWLTSCGPAPYIGLNWRAGVAAKGTAKAFSKLAKAIDDSSFAQVLSPINATFISLQRNVMIDELNAFKTALGAPLHDASALTDDIEDLLALLSLLDENVGVSNTNMHLRAGLGLGSKVLVQSPGGDWRWGYEGNQSLWFSQSKVYRQNLSGDWANALQTVQDDLVEKYGVAQKVSNSHVVENIPKVTSKRCIWLTAGRIETLGGVQTSNIASARYRVIIPANHLEKLGWKSEILNEGLSQVMGGWGGVVPQRGDTLMVSKVFTQHSITLIKDAKLRGARVFIDICDNFFWMKERGDLQRQLCALADVLTSPTVGLAEVIQKETGKQAFVIPDPLETNQQSPVFNVENQLKVMWYGDQKNYRALYSVFEEFNQLAQSVNFEFTLITQLTDIGLSEHWNKLEIDGMTKRYVSWSPQVMATEFERCDLVIIPIKDDEFGSVKSANRLTEAIQAGKFVVAQPLPAYQPFADYAWIGLSISEGITWAINNPDLALKKISLGQHVIANEFNPSAIALKWNDLLLNKLDNAREKTDGDLLITEAYRAEQQALHLNHNYGVASLQFAPLIGELIRREYIQEILDYGCGKQRLLESLATQNFEHQFQYFGYDPAILEYSMHPKSREFVTCIDVLEHIEPKLLDNVLDDLKALTSRLGFFTVHCGPALKVLSDGRNAHLTQAPKEWWLPKFSSRFNILNVQDIPNGFWILLENKSIGQLSNEPDHSKNLMVSLPKVDVELKKCVVVISYYDKRAIDDLQTLINTIDAYDPGFAIELAIVVNQETQVELAIHSTKFITHYFYRKNEGMNIGAWDYGWRQFNNADCFIFLQDECRIVKNNWVIDYIEALKNQSIGLIGEAVNQRWNRPWSELIADENVNDDIQTRAKEYLAFMQRNHIASGDSARHLRSLIWACKASTLKEINGFPIGSTLGECIAAEISVSKQIEQVGLKVIQLDEEKSFSRIVHTEWSSKHKIQPLKFDTAFSYGQSITINQANYKVKPRYDLFSLIDQRPKRVCEIGCADGTNLIEISKLFDENIQVENLVGVDLVKDDSCAHYSKFQFFHQTAEEFVRTYQALRFDLILLSDVVEHLYNPWEFMCQLRSQLSIKGRVILSVPNIQNIQYINSVASGAFNYTNTGLLDVTHIRFFSVETLTQLLETAGYRVLKQSFRPDLCLQNLKKTAEKQLEISEIANIQFGNVSMKIAATEIERYFSQQILISCVAI